MFALLEHRQRANAASTTGAPGAAPEVHWDLLVEIPGQERLPTWRLSANPIETDAPIAAARIQDHRRIYLDYEGPLSGERGWVRHLDRGEAHLQHAADPEGEITIELRGRFLNGEFRLVPAGPALSFRHA
jgi:hypothetical protein